MTDARQDPTTIAEALLPHAVPIEAPTHHPRNPRVGNVDAIAESLARFGQVRPIMLQASTGHVIAGNHTLKAAKSLGWTRIAAVPVDLNDEDAVAYLLADNRLADLGEYDNAALAELMQMAGGLVGTGYDEDDAIALMDSMPDALPTETVRVDDLREHERNPRAHTPEQLEHLTASLREHGIFREIVIANDGTILAGHGIVAALRDMGLRKIPAKRLPYGPNDPEALKVIAADNEIGRLAERDDRALTELLRDVRESGDVSDLLGTGLDAEQLASLVLTTRPESEIRDTNAAAEWVGMPDFEPQAERIKLVLAFDSEADRDTLIEQLGLIIAKKTRQTWSAWWPPRELEDLSSLRFERDGEPDDEGDAAPEAGAEVPEADTSPVGLGTGPVDPPIAEQDAANAEAEAALGAQPARDPIESFSGVFGSTPDEEPDTTAGAVGDTGVDLPVPEQPPVPADLPPEAATDDRVGPSGERPADAPRTTTAQVERIGNVLGDPEPGHRPASALTADVDD